MTKLRIGFSPCPNDTFIFDALIHGKIDTEGLEFDACMADVEELNLMAFRGELDITKLSYHAFLHILEEYVMMDSGSALGNNCGPLLIKNVGDKNPIESDLIAIPGKYTTANFLLNYAFPKLQNKQEILFSDIESAIKNKQVSAGLIIHENRFTYADRGFEKVKDLGEDWEQSTGMPIPLGGIAIKRNFDKALQEKVQRLIRKSIEFAFNNPLESLEYVKLNAQEMDAEVMQKHINLYVNDYSISLGAKGKSAIQYMYDFSVEKKLIDGTSKDLFV
ncbi:MAG: 1,4-dihydroxy-6-naphthoate synthase [Flavobacteriales bacterium]|jgi:1,4-dihydroxy-6-naphthoate synthase|tara:strand:+ start:1889 stop:2716 length:828 start_codon:yes stop_codon:yes gene_type:complete